MTDSSELPSGRTIERLSLYRAVLRRLREGGSSHIFSHELGSLAGATSAQVRRDLMLVGGYGTAAHGYEIDQLLKSISDFMDTPEPARVALVGVGNLGRAILTYFEKNRPHMKIVAAFDKDGRKNKWTFAGVPCHPVEKMENVIREENIQVGIIAVPAEAAQSVADTLVEAGVHGMLSLAPVCLRAPEHVYVETADLGVFLEKIVYFASHTTNMDP